MDRGVVAGVGGCPRALPPPPRPPCSPQRAHLLETQSTAVLHPRLHGNKGGLAVQAGEAVREGGRAVHGLVENKCCALCIQSQEGSGSGGEAGREHHGGKWRPGRPGECSQPTQPSSHHLYCFSSQVLINASPARLTILPISRDTINTYC